VKNLTLRIEQESQKRSLTQNDLKAQTQQLNALRTSEKQLKQEVNHLLDIKRSVEKQNQELRKSVPRTQPSTPTHPSSTHLPTQTQTTGTNFPHFIQQTRRSFSELFYSQQLTNLIYDLNIKHICLSSLSFLKFELILANLNYNVSIKYICLSLCFSLSFFLLRGLLISIIILIWRTSALV